MWCECEINLVKCVEWFCALKQNEWNVSGLFLLNMYYLKVVKIFWVIEFFLRFEVSFITRIYLGCSICLSLTLKVCACFYDHVCFGCSFRFLQTFHLLTPQMIKYVTPWFRFTEEPDRKYHDQVESYLVCKAWSII